MKNKSLKRRFLDKFFPVKVWGVEASDTESRGKCYTLLSGRLLISAFPSGMMYEKNHDGTINQQLKKVIIL